MMHTLLAYQYFGPSFHFLNEHQPVSCNALTMADPSLRVLHKARPEDFPPAPSPFP